MTNNAPVRIRLHGDRGFEIDQTVVEGSDGLQEVLAQLAQRQPQPGLLVCPDEADDYEQIGKVIYTVYRVGFEEGKLTFMPRDEA